MDYKWVNLSKLGFLKKIELNIPSDRGFSGLSENHKIIRIRPSELKLWLYVQFCREWLECPFTIKFLPNKTKIISLFFCLGADCHGYQQGSVLDCRTAQRMIHLASETSGYVVVRVW